MDRDHSIDAFRGLAIILMVFFTVTLKLSEDLPEVLRHNVRGSLHLGDFVLPMFLFASGLSLVFFLKKYGNKGKKDILKIVNGRFAKLALVGISLSYFSANGFLEMDEVMLSAILFLICILLSKLDWKVLLSIIFAIDISYIILILMGLTNIFKDHYLGGYPAAFFYIPIMLFGLILGKGMIKENLWSLSNKISIGMAILFFLLTWVFIPIDKLEATSSYVMLSILFSILIFIIFNKIIQNKKVQKNQLILQLEFLGRTPLRYWLMMYIVVIIPLKVYVEINNMHFPLSVPWLIGIGISLGLIILLWMISKIIERSIIERSD
jgi:predicted acyltransferase